MPHFMLAKIFSPERIPYRQRKLQWAIGLALSLFFACFYGYLAMAKGLFRSLCGPR